MYNNPYYSQQRFQPMPMQPTYNQPIIPQTQQLGLLGKVVDGVDVVKSMDIPLDGSISYFPLADNSIILTKQLQSDGTSKITMFKPVQEEQKELPKYATIDDLKNAIEDIDLSEIDDIKEDIKELKKEFKNIKKSKED